MFCTNCGREIKDGAQFCVHCGSAQTVDTQGSYGWDTYQSYGQNETVQGAIGDKLKALTVLDWGIVLLYFITVFRWGKLFFTSLMPVWNAFHYVEADFRLLLMILYIVPSVIVIGFCVAGLWSVTNKKYHISIGIILCVLGLIFKIGQLIFATAIYGTAAHVAFRIFKVYGSVGVFTILMGIGIGILLYTRASSTHK